MQTQTLIVLAAVGLLLPSIAPTFAQELQRESRQSAIPPLQGTLSQEQGAAFADTNVVELLFVVMKEALEENAENRRYFLRLLDNRNALQSAMDQYRETIQTTVPAVRPCQECDD
jgi:hypothetical protein